MNITKLFEKNPNGFSITLKGKKVSKGFGVSLTNNRTKRKRTLQQKYREVRKLLKTLSFCGTKVIGGWYYRGFYYLDATIVVKSRREARVIARMFGQKAVWDFAKKKSIFVS
ncbi:MAG: hypothetical protein ACTSYG_08530 [Candidatus Heimdallarchaeota archaeon]